MVSVIIQKTYSKSGKSSFFSLLVEETQETIRCASKKAAIAILSLLDSKVFLAETNTNTNTGNQNEKQDKQISTQNEPSNSNRRYGFSEETEQKGSAEHSHQYGDRAISFFDRGAEAATVQIERAEHPESAHDLRESSGKYRNLDWACSKFERSAARSKRSVKRNDESVKRNDESVKRNDESVKRNDESVKRIGIEIAEIRADNAILLEIQSDIRGILNGFGWSNEEIEQGFKSEPQKSEQIGGNGNSLRTVYQPDDPEGIPRGIQGSTL